MRTKPSLWLTALALVPALAAPALGQPRPVGSEFRVNPIAESKQHNPVAAFNAAGSALVVWENENLGLRGRFYGRDGAPQTGELALVANQKLTTVPAQGTEILRKDPAVAFLSGGEFLLAWTEEQDDVTSDIFIERRTVLERDVYLQKFNAAGVAQGSPLRLNTTTDGFQSVPKILVRNGADAVVVWQSDDRTRLKAGDGIFGRLVRTSNGQPNSAELKLSTSPGLAANAAIAGDPAGAFLVTWEGPDANAQGVFARYFTKAAAPKGNAFRVNTDFLGLQRRPAVSYDRNTGGYLVVWQGQAGTIKDSHVYGQFLGANGGLVGPQVRVSQGVAQGQISPSIAAAGGNFLVTWLDYQDIFPVGLYAVEIDKLGAAVGAEVQINTAGINAQSRTSIAVSATGDVLVPWEGFTASPDRPVISARRVQF